MMVREITLSAIRQLESEIEKYEAQAKRELEKRKTRAVGLLRADLLREYRQRLTFMKYMLRDAKDRSARRRKSESPSTNCGRSEGPKVGLPSKGACIVPVLLRTIQHYGNSSSATMPIAITEGVESGPVQSGNIPLLTAVGASMLSAGLVIRWQAASE